MQSINWEILKHNMHINMEMQYGNLMAKNCFFRLLNFLKILFPSISTGPTRISLSSRIELYRCLEIVGKELNHFGSSRIVPAVLIVCPMVQIFYTFVLIKFYKTQSVGGIITYCTVVILCVLASMAFDTFASQIGVKSDQRRKEWGKERGLKKVERKILTSLQPIRIRIGSNFVDRDTALVTQDFCLKQTASLLLM